MPSAELTAAHLAVVLLHVRIEEGFSVERDPRQERVVYHEFSRVGVFRVGLEQRHAPREKRERQVRAGLGVGRHVWQIVIAHEGLVDTCLAYRPRHVHPAVNYIVKYGGDGIAEAAVASHTREVGRSRVEIAGPDRMAFCGPLIGHRGMVLRMGAARLASAFPYEIISEICVFRVSGRLRQFYQRELDLLVTGRREGGRLFYIENVVDQIGVVSHEAQEPVLPRRVAVGDRSLDQVAGAVELVLRAVGEPAVGVDIPEI